MPRILGMSGGALSVGAVCYLRVRGLSDTRPGVAAVLPPHPARKLLSRTSGREVAAHDLLALSARRRQPFPVENAQDDRLIDLVAALLARLVREVGDRLVDG